jgi:yjeF C-terminal region, hydroxyethylthiazole kinase-related/yjeF N-terminal region
MLTLEEILAIEENAVELGISRLMMMENAASNISNFIKNRSKVGKVLVFAGTGNKAGDGFATSRQLAYFGYKIKVILSDKEENIKAFEASVNFNILKNLNLNIEILNSRDLSDGEILKELEESNVVIDALIGTGIRGELKGEIARLVRFFNEAKCLKISIDIPTGIDPTTGKHGSIYAKPDVIITMHRAKKGLEKLPFNAEIIEANIGIPPEAETYVGRGNVKYLLSPRDPFSKKGDNGTVLVIGGSKIYHGAPLFTSLAALRSGVDLVFLMVPNSIAPSIRSYTPDLIVLPYEGDSLEPNAILEYERFIKKADCIAIGPGLGQNVEEGVKTVFDIAKKYKKMLVVDADALKTNIAKERKEGITCVYTPHAGEFKILTGVEPAPLTNLEERINQVKENAEKLNVIILLKGHIDIISDGRRFKLNRTGIQAMTVGGTGDVLTGLCAGLIARTKKVYESVLAAAYINGIAGRKAVEKYGNQINSSDLIKEIPIIIKEFDPTYG